MDSGGEQSMPDGDGEFCEVVNPKSWPRPRGYSNGILCPSGGRILMLAGQVGWDSSEKMVVGGFVAQFHQALLNIRSIVEAAGGEAHNVVRILGLLGDKLDYLDNLKEIGSTWREVFGGHYPAMSFVEVAGFVEEGALLELQADAWLPSAE
ncbi:MAG: RidA family protein [Candidatus Thalassarchaeaceae archaeon]|nr:RidA family protein [Candidatus Thalassarchaeaceae archaeon]MDP7446060.1 RidA family protein [Candidatus Thalassarchaeaceae archaeon]HJL54743.1 RidA family protein [Candidatus Thalassarchaeaceae archaeon]HJM77888.1 RidA family protein [Candidatus Thalassarchaeaceae archaeon]